MNCIRRIVVASVLSGALALAAVAPSAWAGTNGQQVLFDSAAGALRGANTDVVAMHIWGHRQTDWRWVRWPAPRPGTSNPWPNARPTGDGSRAWIPGWWWKGNLEVFWETSDGNWHRTDAWIPEGDDKSFQHIWNDTVLVTWRGSMQWGSQSGNGYDMGTFTSLNCYSLPWNPYGLYHRWGFDWGYYGWTTDSSGHPYIAGYAIGGSERWPLNLAPRYPGQTTWKFRGCGA